MTIVIRKRLFALDRSIVYVIQKFSKLFVNSIKTFSQYAMGFLNTTSHDFNTSLDMIAKQLSN